MKYKAFLYFLFLLVAAVPVAQTIKEYNVVWTTQSKNASESMPCGGGDMGMNVWVENGDLLIYIARSGSFNEDNALMKSGRIRIQCSPNIFDGKKFKQELHLQEGYVSVEGENNGVKAMVKIWADVFKPVAHIDIEASKKITVTAALLDRFLLRKASTAGFNPVAKNNAIKISTKICETLASARIKIIAVRAPRVAINPK